MQPHLLRFAITTGIALVCAAPPLALGQIYKCTDDSGRTTYADAPCNPGSKPLKLPGEANAKPAGPHVCAQLQDEMNRLAAEADRNARSGRAESTDSAKRRQTLARRYEERCVGIARSASKPP